MDCENLPVSLTSEERANAAQQQSRFKTTVAFFLSLIKGRGENLKITIFNRTGPDVFLDPMQPSTLLLAGSAAIIFALWHKIRKLEQKTRSATYKPGVT